MTGKAPKLNIDLQRVKRFRFELTGAVVLIILTVVFVLAWRRDSAGIKEIDGMIASRSAEAARIEAEASTVAGLERALEEATRNLTLLQEKQRAMSERLPSDGHISRLLADLSESGHGVRIVSIKPLAPEEKGELARLPFQISMESRFVPFGAYVERIENLPRLMVIDNITIEPKEDGSNTLNTSLFLSAYVHGYGGRR